MVLPHSLPSLCLSSLVLTLVLFASEATSSSVNVTKIGNGYSLISIQETSDGALLGLLQINKKTKIYGPDIPLLRFYAKHETDNRLRVHITDANKERWEVPYSLIPREQPHVQQPSPPSSLNCNELAKFASIVESWRGSDGPFKPLHVMNPTRLAFIQSALCRHFKKDPYSAKPLEGLKIADVGCRGGILSEPLARMGATVTGIDAVEKNINIARLHAESDPATSTIEFCCTTAEKLVEEGRKFDAVMALEVIEHVTEPAEFCKSLSALTIPDGARIISTINRSMRAYATAIVAAEYILTVTLFNEHTMFVHRVISLVGAQKASLHPDDMLLLANFVMSSESFRTSESFSPVCLPRYNPSAFLLPASY